MSESVKQRVLDATGFALPRSYLRLLALGRLKFGENREHWKRNWRTILLTEPPTLICSPWHLRVEWITVDEMLAWKAPEYWKPNRFIPFAGNGYGDLWCWDPGREEGGKCPVVLCRHDENETEIFAGSFETFLYRVLVESFADLSSDDLAELSADESQVRGYLALNVTSVAEFLPAEHVATLMNILKKEFRTGSEEDHLFLIDEAEKNQILERDVKIRDIGTTFEHMLR